jgi:hypothetical protein
MKASLDYTFDGYRFHDKLKHAPKIDIVIFVLKYRL